MLKRTMASLAIASVTLALTSGIALAAEMEVVPDSIPEAGESEFEITLTDFEPDTAIFVLPCPPPASGDIDDIDADSCEVTEVTAATTDANGKATMKVIWNVPAEGVAFLAGNEARTDAVGALVTVEATQVLGSQEDDELTDDETAADEPADDGLADTGSETIALVAIGLALLVAGIAGTTAGRRLTAA